MRTELGLPILPPVGETPSPAPTRPSVAPADGASFAAELGRAIDGVDQLQLAADAESTKAAQGAGNVHELAIALEKADVALRLAVKVRNKVLEAYNDIMRMSV